MERLCAAGDVETASRLEAGQAMPLYHELDEITDKLQDIQLISLKKEKERAASTSRFNRILSFASLVLAFLISAFAFLVVRRIGATLLAAKEAVEAEAQHRQSLADLGAAVEQAADSVVITDSDGSIRYVNPAFTAMTGYTSRGSSWAEPALSQIGTHARRVLRRALEHHPCRPGLAWRVGQPAQGRNLL